MSDEFKKNVRRGGLQTAGTIGGSAGGAGLGAALGFLVAGPLGAMVGCGLASLAGGVGGWSAATTYDDNLRKKESGK